MITGSFGEVHRPLVPCRRVALHVGVVAGIIAVWGFADAILAAGPATPRFGLVAFALDVPLGFVLWRLTRKPVEIDGLQEIPVGRLVEPRLRTTRRTLLLSAPFVATVAVGLFRSEVGAVGGGLMAGECLYATWTFLALRRAERHRGWHLVQEVAPHRLVARVPHRAYFRSPGSALDTHAM